MACLWVQPVWIIEDAFYLKICKEHVLFRILNMWKWQISKEFFFKLKILFWQKTVYSLACKWMIVLFLKKAPVFHRCGAVYEITCDIYAAIILYAT